VANEANYRMFLGAFSDSRQFDADACTLLLDDPGFVSSLATTTEDNLRADLIDQIIALLTKARSPEQLDAERKRLAFFSTDALKTRVAELEQMKNLERNNSRRQLHVIGTPNRVGPEPVPPSLTRAEFKKMNQGMMRKTIARYTQQALNAAWARQEGRA
jgi:hypothetical protein